MKQCLLGCGLLLFALWFCLPSAYAADGKLSTSLDMPARYKELLPKAGDYLKDPKRKWDDCKNPDDAILAPDALVMLWKQAGSPEPKKAPPFSMSSTLYYYKAVCWAAENGLLEALGYQPTKAEAKEAFRKAFPKMKLHNKDVVTLFYQREWKRLGKAPELPKDTNTKSKKLAPYEDVYKTAPYANAVRWAGAQSRNLISGVLDETIKKALYFHPEQEKIGKGICTRGQFFVLLYLYAQSLENSGKTQQKAAA